VEGGVVHVFDGGWETGDGACGYVNEHAVQLAFRPEPTGSKLDGNYNHRYSTYSTATWLEEELCLIDETDRLANLLAMLATLAHDAGRRRVIVHPMFGSI
jgi:hypothetical protein